MLKTFWTQTTQARRPRAARVRGLREVRNRSEGERNLLWTSLSLTQQTGTRSLSAHRPVAHLVGTPQVARGYAYRAKFLRYKATPLGNGQARGGTPLRGYARSRPTPQWEEDTRKPASSVTSPTGLDEEAAHGILSSLTARGADRGSCASVHPTLLHTCRRRDGWWIPRRGGQE